VPFYLFQIAQEVIGGFLNKYKLLCTSIPRKFYM